MLTKLHVALFICLLGFQISCKTEQTSATSINTQPTIQKDISDEEIKQLFLDSGLGEGDGNLEKLMKLPKERVIKVVQKIKDENKDNPENYYFAIKSSYFLWKLGIDKVVNEKFVVDKAKAKPIDSPNGNHYSKYEAIGFMGAFIENGKKEYLPIVFEATPKADASFAMTVFGIITNELANSPKPFLQYLSKEPVKVRKSIYEFVSYSKTMGGEKTFEKIISNVKQFENDDNLKGIVKEFLKETK